MRREDRKITDNLQIESIIERAKIVHIGMVDKNRPYVIPMQYGFVFSEGRLTLYLHCAKEGRKLDILRENPNVFIELETGISLISGGDVPCRYGSAYESVMGDGKAKIVEDIDEKIFGLKSIMKTQTGRDFSISEKMTKAVTVLKIDVPNVTGKSRPKI